MIDSYVERFEHPYLFTLVPIACLLFGLAFVADAIGWDFRAGFLALFAIVALIDCLIGYLAFGTLKFTTQTLRWWRIRSLEDDDSRVDRSSAGKTAR